MAIKYPQKAKDAEYNNQASGLAARNVQDAIDEISGGWVSWTPTGSWNTNVTYTGAYLVRAHTLLAYFKIALSGVPNSTSLTVNLPAAYPIANALVPVDNEELSFGSATITDAGTAGYNGVITPHSGSTTSVRVKYLNVSGSLVRQNNVTQAVPIATLVNGDVVRGWFEVPI